MYNARRMLLVAVPEPGNEILSIFGESEDVWKFQGGDAQRLGWYIWYHTI